MHDRMAELGMTQTDVAEAGGPSAARLRQIDAIADRDAEVIGFQPGTLRKLDAALRWEQGSARDVLAGGFPRPLPAAPQPAAPQPAVVRSGQGFLIPPPELAEALGAMTPAERAEAEARMWAEAFRAAREFEANRH
jgi:hypothetical protein